MPPIIDHPPRMPLWDAVSRSGGGWRVRLGKRIAPSLPAIKTALRALGPCGSQRRHRTTYILS